MYTRQQAFDKVKKHLLTQKERSLAKTGDSKVLCLYRGADGKRCAVGALIPDARYRPEMDEHNKVTGIKFDREFVFYFRLNDLFDVRDIQFFQDLQKLHDQQYLDWNTALADFAKKYRIRNTQFK